MNPKKHEPPDPDTRRTNPHAHEQAKQRGQGPRQGERTGERGQLSPGEQLANQRMDDDGGPRRQPTPQPAQPRTQSARMPQPAKPESGVESKSEAQEPGDPKVDELDSGASAPRQREARADQGARRN